MSEFFYVLVYVFMIYHGLDSGAVVPEPFATQELCQEAAQTLYGLAPGDITQIQRGEMQVVVACMKVKRQ
jgi:hypothetical protein